MNPPVPQRRRQAVIFLVAAMAVASGTAWFAHKTIATYRERVATIEAAAPKVTRVVAARTLQAGEPIKAEDVRLDQVSSDVAPEASLYSDTLDVVGAVSRERTLAGEPVRAERLGQGSDATPLPTVISVGQRAVTVLAERAAGLAGLVQPGDHVDVIVTIRPDTNSLGADWVTETIVQDAKVLAVGPVVLGAPPQADEKIEGRARRAELVTIEVFPTEAEMLAMSAARGDLHLALRSAEDQEIIATRGPLVTNALVGLERVARPAAAEKAARRAKAAVEPEPPATQGAEVIEGVLTSVQQFDSGGARVVDTPNRRRTNK